MFVSKKTIIHIGYDNDGDGYNFAKDYIRFLDNSGKYFSVDETTIGMTITVHENICGKYKQGDLYTVPTAFDRVLS